MKPGQHTHQQLFCAVFLSMFSFSVIGADEPLSAPPSVDEIPQKQLQIKTETIYESSFLPGVRLCEDDEVDYRGDFRKVNCQDDALINAVSTRKEDPYNTQPNIIVDDRIKPNGNIFRINFRKKNTVVENSTEN